MTPPGTSGIVRFVFNAQDGQLPGAGMPTPYSFSHFFRIISQRVPKSSQNRLLFSLQLCYNTLNWFVIAI